MAYYLQIVKNVELLRMSAEFYKDELGFIWFFYAKDIYTRKVKNKKTISSEEAKLEAKRQQQNKEKVRQTMIDELHQYEQQRGNVRNVATQRMLDMMNSYYNELKTEVGLEEKDDHDEEDHSLEDLLRALKPNTTAKNFKEFLTLEGNCTRTQAWRAISRKMYRQDRKQSLGSGTLGSGNAFITQTDCDPKNMKVQDLFQAF